MATIKDGEAPLIVITGPTGSGKTGLALELAKKYDGEIICADSRTIYSGMDIGTAKPTREERARVSHHLLDIVEPGERFTVHDFQRLAMETIRNIRQRGNIPFLVGGTGLYIDSVTLGYEFVNDDPEKRRVLSDKSIEELVVMIKNQRLSLPFNYKNKRHLIQVLMQGTKPIKSNSIPYKNTHVVAIATETSMLERRLRSRTKDMFSSGALREAKELGEMYGWENEAMTGNIYPILRQVINGSMSREEAEELIIIRDRQLAKRQITWLKRHEYVRCLSLGDAREYIKQLLLRHV